MELTMSQSVLPDSYEGIHERARTLLQSGDIEGSIVLYRRLTDKLNRLTDRILDRRPQLRDLHQQARLELTNLLASEGRYAEAMEVERVLLKTHPDEADTWRRDLAILRAAKGEVEAGLAELRALAEEASGEPERWLVLGVESRLAARLRDSQDALERALEECEEDDTTNLVNTHFQRFLLFREMKQVDDALTAWDEAVSRNPDVVSTVREVYTMLTDEGRYKEALLYVARDPNLLQSGLQRGLLASLTGKSIEAKQEWREVADLDPSEFEYGHDAWVEAVLRLGDPDPALEWLQESLPEYGTPRLIVLSGIGWAMRQDIELATALFQQAINMLRRQRPPKQKLDRADWQLLDSLVTDDETKTPLKSYFAVVETLWG
jgi:tetratricopeptide (TPR) repeat protein